MPPGAGFAPAGGSRTVTNGVTSVRVLCAWCVRDGKPAFLREKLPLDDLSETHGLCEDHFTSLSRSVKQVVTPQVWLLSRLNDLSWGLTRWIQRQMGRLLFLS